MKQELEKPQNFRYHVNNYNSVTPYKIIDSQQKYYGVFKN